MRHFGLCIIAAALIANEEPPTQPNAETEFVGRYDGSSFETAMGMEILADGTWGWGLSVGALDMRSKGTWEQKGDFIHLTSTPKPVEPEFKWSGLETADRTPNTTTNAGRDTGQDTGPKSTPIVRVVWAKSGKTFQYAHAELTCTNGKTFSGQVRSDGYPSTAALEYEDPLPAQYDPHQSCDTPDILVLKQTIHSVRSKPFKLAQLGWKPGMTARFAFHPNDMGVADFTGVTGYLEDGKLKLVGAEWPLEMRKIPPREQPSGEEPAAQ